MHNGPNRYGLTAARAHDADGRARRPSTPTIDIHAHIVVPAGAAIAQPHVDMSKIPLAHFANAETKSINATQDQDRFEVITQHDKRLRDLDAMGIDIQVIAPAPGQCYYTVDPKIAAKAHQVVNEGVAEFVSKHPDRFIPMGTVPMQDGVEAAKELEHVMKTLKFKGVEILTNVHGKELSDPAFAPFWKKAEELGALVAIHPNGFTEGQRLSRFYFNNIVGNPFETTLALHYLIFDGVLERHPNLKLFAMHGGGYLGGYSGRIDHAWGARSDSLSLIHI